LKNKILDFFVRVLSVEERITFLLRLKNQHAAKRRFLTFLQIDYYLNQQATQQKTAMAFKKLERKINTFEKIRRDKQWKYFRIAAVLVIGLPIAGIQFNSKKIKSLPQLDTQSVVKIGTDKAVLTLEDGQQIPLEKGHQYQSANPQSNGIELVYESEVTEQPIRHNTLTIPRGGQFALTLSDGTKVWLNSDTRLKYPVRFPMTGPREVELLYGEAYFEVRPSSDTNGSPFRVIGQEQTIEVLGTAFNIQNYQNEPLTTTTLVEGKIKITTPDGAVQLAPQQQLVFEKTSGARTTYTLDDVYEIISWKEGVFSFNDLALAEIVTVLSRWYDVEFEWEKPISQNKRFVGVFRKKQPLERILETLKSAEVVKSYTLDYQKVKLE